MTPARAHPSCLLLALVSLSAWLPEAADSPSDRSSILSFPAEIRKRNYVRLSTQPCEECMTMEDFYKGNRLAFVLFFEHALMGQHRYKEAIVNGWIATCKDLRWSRIACGMVDMVTDRAYAERYIEPKTAPAHILVVDGEPVQTTKEDVEMLMKRPGDQAIMLSHIAGTLKSTEGSMAGLRISQGPMNDKAFRSLLDKHRVVIAGFVGEKAALAEAFRAAAQEAVWQGLVPAELPGSEEQGRKGKGKKTKGRQERSRVIFAAVQAKCGADCDGAYEDGLAAFVDGKVVKSWSASSFKLGDKAFREAIGSLAAAALDSAVKSGSDSGVGDSSAPEASEL